MNKDSYFYKIVVKKKNLKGSKIILAILGIFSCIFYLVIKLRILVYKIGLFKTYNFNKPIISIGNIVVGGSGKTPFVELLYDILKNRFNQNVAVLLRGYGAKVNAGDPTSIIDEEMVLKKNLKGVHILSGKNRVKNHRLAIDKLSVDSLILDDGFQHLRLNRDLDIVLLKPNLLEERFLLPAGLLREPFWHLKRAKVFVITDIDRASKENIEHLSNFLYKINPPALILSARYIVSGLFDIKEDEEKPLESKIEKSFLGVCGIADPGSFKYSLSKLGLRLSLFIDYPDHYEYKKKDIDYIIDSASNVNLSYIITTQKDIYKFYPYLDEFTKADIKVLALKIKLELEDRDQDKLYDKLSIIFNS